ncbi:MAG: DNA replication/repair protein RecF [bacterium]
MRLDTVTLEGFRNYAATRVSFSPEVNVLIGDNAQGKTNLLEAIYLLATGRSFRTRSDKELIGFDRDAALLRAEGFSRERERRLELILRRFGRRSVTANGVRLKTAAALSEHFSAVLFCPEDLGLIREGAAIRRKLLDGCLSQLRPRYAASLAAFTRAYEQKTRILRDAEALPALMELLPEYDLELARRSAELISYRARFVRALAPLAAEIHADFSGGEALTVRYATVSTVRDPYGPVEDIFSDVMAHQESHRAAERASRLCLTGAHKDDLLIQIGGRDARTYASQGQTRTAALSLKLAEREMHLRDRGEYPILLLDDVLSELDPARQGFILNRIRGGQVFITCCEDDGVITGRTGGRVIQIKGGSAVCTSS